MHAPHVLDIARRLVLRNGWHSPPVVAVKFIMLSRGRRSEGCQCPRRRYVAGISSGCRQSLSLTCGLHAPDVLPSAARLWYCLSAAPCRCCVLEAAVTYCGCIAVWTAACQRRVLRGDVAAHPPGLSSCGRCCVLVSCRAHGPFCRRIPPSKGAPALALSFPAGVGPKLPPSRPLPQCPLWSPCLWPDRCRCSLRALCCCVAVHRRCRLVPDLPLRACGRCWTLLVLVWADCEPPLPVAWCLASLRSCPRNLSVATAR